MRQARQPGRGGARSCEPDQGAAASSGDAQDQWQPQPSTSQGGGDPAGEVSSGGLLSPRPSSGSPHRRWPVVGGGGSDPPSPAELPAGRQHPAFQGEPGGADSQLVSSSTGPLEGGASVGLEAPPATPGMSALIDSTVADPESPAGPSHLPQSESEEEPEDGTSSRSGGRLNLASAAAPEQPGPSGRQAGSVLLTAVHERYEPDTGGSALVIYDYLDGLPADSGDPGDPDDPDDPALGSGDGRQSPAGQGEAEGEGSPHGGPGDGPPLAPEEREALRRERAESRAEARRRPEPPLLPLQGRHHVQHHQQHGGHHVHNHGQNAGLSHDHHPHRRHVSEHDRDGAHGHLMPGGPPDLLVPLPDPERGPDLLVPLPADSDPEADPESGLLAMECDGDGEPLLPLEAAQEGLFEREAALSEVDSEDGVDGHAVILADGGQYRLSESEEEAEELEASAGRLQQEMTEDGSAVAPAGGSAGAELAQLPVIYLAEGLEISLAGEARDGASSHLLVQVPPAYERQQLTHQNDFWCEECSAYYRGRCPDHQVRLISDRPMQSRAWASLPTNYLSIRAVTADPEHRGETVYGVIAKKTIPKRTQFGPMEGILVKRDRGVTPANPTGLVLSVDNGGQLHTVDVSNPDCSNWMRFVRRAERPEQQNLALNQQGSHLFLTSCREIGPREELRAGYSLPYAARRRLPLLSSSAAADGGCCAELRPEEPPEAAPDSGEDGLPDSSPRQPDEDPDDPDWPLSCDGCGHCFSSLSSLERHRCHLQQEEEEEEPPQRRRGRPPGQPRGQSARQTEAAGGDADSWLCQYCQLSFESASTLNLHTLAHAAEDLEDSGAAGEDVPEQCILGLPADRPVSCPECSREFADKEQLIRHVASHGTAPADRRPFGCDTCGRRFRHEEWLKRHVASHVPDEEKPVVCVTCDKRFVTASALQAHRRVHAGGVRRYRCPLCRALFAQLSALREHVRIHLTNGKYVCPHCEKAFATYMMIRKHIHSFHNDRVYVCSVCYKPCQSSDKLKQHMLKHSDHREFLCSECGKQFKRKDKLKEHMKRLHPSEPAATQDGERKPRKQKKPRKKRNSSNPGVPATDYHRFIYKCHMCKLGFKRRGMLVNHLARRHPGMGPEQVPELMLPILKTTKDFYCQYCFKTYKSSSKRKAHILKNHPGAELPVSTRGVKLPLGEMADQTTYSQTVGSVTMSPHGCGWCHKQYASRAKLLQHQRQKHRELLPPESQRPRPSVRARRARAERRQEPDDPESSSEESGPAAAEGPAPASPAPPAPVPVSVIAAAPGIAVTPAELQTAQAVVVQAAHPAIIQDTAQPIHLEQAELLSAGVELHSLDYRLVTPAAPAPSAELCRVWTVHNPR